MTLLDMAGDLVVGWREAPRESSKASTHRRLGLCFPTSLTRGTHASEGLMPEEHAGCPFCPVDPSRVIGSWGSVYAVADAYPVSSGHTLVIPYRHCATAFDLDSVEWSDMYVAVAALKQRMDELHSPDGYNVGFNVGLSGGQTVMHAHLHVIPRYEGDVPNPRGGLRGVIPGQADYTASTDGAHPQRSNSEERNG